MLDLSFFEFIDSDNFRIGINSSDANQISNNLFHGKIKREHILASSPPRDIKVNSFYISKKLITVKEFSRFIEDAKYITESEKEGWGWVWEGAWKKREGVSWEKPFGDTTDIIYRDNAERFPVMQVSWNDAVAYTEWRSRVENEDIRIPTEFEWEIFAGKAGVKSISQPYFSEENINSEIKDSKDFINRLEINLGKSGYNIGLLWEWTLDWYNGYTPDMAIKDFGNIYKVLRGGSLLSEEIQKSREFRFRRCPTARSPYYGFRIVLSSN